jgi:hypothetical protein
MRKSSLGIKNTISFSFTSIKNLAARTLVKAVCKLGYCISTMDFMAAVKDIIVVEESDPYAQIIASFAWSHQVDTYMFVTTLVYSKPEHEPPVFEKFKAFKSVYSSTKIQEFTGVYNETNEWNVVGRRYVHFLFALIGVRNLADVNVN